MLATGIDVPFPELRMNIHQPSMKEISFIGEETFFLGCEILNFSKDKFLNDEDKNNLEDKSNFQVFMTILKGQNPNAQKSKICAMMVLSLIFPEYRISFQKNHIAFTKEGESDTHSLSDDNFEKFKEIIVSIFCLKKSNNEGLNYNPGNDAARKIAERFRKNRAKIAEMKGESKKVSILSRYISILVIGQHKSFESFLNYTVYQLFDEFERYELKENYDWILKAKMAGAKDLDEVDNWMKELHP
ncbi:MAG: hypothetical protein [Caudoviricetes sp.]|nr:MAG: hypothetical protein [Caudoviricetes sp.]